MGKRKPVVEKVKRIRNLSIAAGGLLLILLLIIFSVAAVSTSRLMKQLDLISAHPFQVVLSAGEMQTRVTDMRIQSERLLYENSRGLAEVVREKLAEDMQYARNELSVIEGQYLGKKADIQIVGQHLNRLETVQEDFLDFVENGSPSMDEITEYCRSRLLWRYTQLEDRLDRIIAVGEKSFDIYYDKASSIRAVMLWLSGISVLAVLAVLMVYRILMRRQNEEIISKNYLFDQLAKTIDYVFMIYDLHRGRKNFISENSERIIGIGSELLFSGMEEFYKQLPAGEREKLESLFRNRERSYWSIILHYINPGNGRAMVLELQAYHLDQDQNDCYIIVLADETETLQSKEALEAALNRAEEAGRAKGEFLSRMSHEMRTPLNGVIGMTMVAQQNAEDPEKTADCLRKISLSSRHLLALINDVLDMSKIESGKIELKAEPFYFDTFVESVRTITEGQALEHKIRFMTEISNDIDQVLRGDALRLKQVMMNLLSNALKFTPEGGKIIFRISLAGESQREQVLRFEVEDTGRGIASENLDKIFLEFEQENVDISYQYGGTGLGLAISRHFVEMMGGHITVSSTQGMGSAFVCEIPLGRVKDNLKEDRKDSMSAGGNYTDLSTCRLEGRHIMIAEDNELNQEIMQELLKPTGAELQIVDNGRLAVEAFESSPEGWFDLILMDVQMPEMSGYQATEKIRALTRKDSSQVLIFAMTANAFAEDMKRSLTYGMNGHLNKPFELEEIRRVLEKIRKPDNFRPVN